jgi:hypothetical protein
LEQLTSESVSLFYREDRTYDQDFSAVHDKIEKWFVKKTTTYMEEFFASPAGVAYLEMFKAARYISLPVCSDYFRAKKEVLTKVETLSREDIAKLVVDGKECEGRPLLPQDVLEFWQPLFILSSTESYEEVLYLLVQI